MGQYYLVVNLDKQEYLHPHKFNDGMKLLEFGCSGQGTMTALAILLADGNGRGGGDLYSDNPIIGTWAGDRIVVAGDYADGGKFVPPSANTEELQAIAEEVFTDGNQVASSVDLYSYAKVKFQDISEKALAAMLDDRWIREDLTEDGRYKGSRFVQALSDALAIREEE